MPHALSQRTPYRTPPNTNRSHLNSLYNGARFAYDNRHSIMSAGRTARSVASSIRSALPRRLSFSSARSMQSQRSTGGLTALSAPSTRIPLKRKRGGDRKTKGRKKVHVSKQFRQKVQACEATSKLSGYYQANYKARIARAPETNLQQSDDQLLNPSPVDGGVFSFANVLNAASRLWNQKVANASPTNADVGNFDYRTTIIDVRKQWAVMRFKNNSLRTLRMKHILASPKSQQNLFTPAQAWTTACNDMTASLRLNGTPTVTQNTMWTHPKAFDQFSTYFTTTETDYTLEPGQSIEETVTGPSMVYDGGKFTQNGGYAKFQKQDIFSLCIYWYDLVIGTTPATLVCYANQPGTNEGLLCQSTYHCHLLMPEPAGWISSGAAPASGPVVLGNRLKKFVYDDFNTFGTVFTVINREDEQNPT